MDARSPKRHHAGTNDAPSTAKNCSGLVTRLIVMARAFECTVLFSSGGTRCVVFKCWQHGSLSNNLKWFAKAVFEAAGYCETSPSTKPCRRIKVWTGAFAALCANFGWDSDKCFAVSSHAMILRIACDRMRCMTSSPEM